MTARKAFNNYPGSRGNGSRRTGSDTRHSAGRGRVVRLPSAGNDNPLFRKSWKAPRVPFGRATTLGRAAAASRLGTVLRGGTFILGRLSPWAMAAFMAYEGYKLLEGTLARPINPDLDFPENYVRCYGPCSPTETRWTSPMYITGINSCPTGCIGGQTGVFYDQARILGPNAPNYTKQRVYSQGGIGRIWMLEGWSRVSSKPGGTLPHIKGNPGIGLTANRPWWYPDPGFGPWDQIMPKPRYYQTPRHFSPRSPTVSPTDSTHTGHDLGPRRVVRVPGVPPASAVQTTTRPNGNSNTSTTPPRRVTRPPRGEKQKKARMAGGAVMQLALAVTNVATETMDLIEVAWWSLPPKVRRRAFVENGYKPVNFYRKAKVIYRNASDIDVQKFIDGFLQEQAEDAFYGRIGRAVGNAQRRLGVRNAVSPLTRVGDLVETLRQ